jgi:hypothetical protein
VVVLHRHGALLLTDRGAVTAHIVRPRARRASPRCRVIATVGGVAPVGWVRGRQRGGRPGTTPPTSALRPLEVRGPGAGVTRGGAPVTGRAPRRAAPSSLAPGGRPAGIGEDHDPRPVGRQRPPGTACWMQADRADADSVRAWQAIIHAVRSVGPRLRRGGARPHRPRRRRGPRRARSGADRRGRPPRHRTGDRRRPPARPRGATTSSASSLDRGLGGLHLALGSRTDPPVGLDRLRAAGRLCELRDQDLRLDRQESEPSSPRSGSPSHPAWPTRWQSTQRDGLRACTSRRSR